MEVFVVYQIDIFPDYLKDSEIEIVGVFEDRNHAKLVKKILDERIDRDKDRNTLYHYTRLKKRILNKNAQQTKRQIEKYVPRWNDRRKCCDKCIDDCFFKCLDNRCCDDCTKEDRQGCYDNGGYKGGN